ncbi:uncharacterized protein LOC128740159 [Sabethes cyaneus]|uniref:uncharacterized protein LOC128740159 n=1 Tax=Sabethes cyaneus TaxID=53552 RepID=UPI00237E99D9|nr:uncharacterized protein LOC128740159 [Sabethes cyaneus]
MASSENYQIDALVVEEVPEEEAELIRLLESFELSQKTIECFLANQYNVQTLKLVERHEVEELIPYPFLAERTKFIYHLNCWRKEQVNPRLQNLPTLDNQAIIHYESPTKDLSNISRDQCTATHLLNASAKGQAIIKRFAENPFLTRSDKKIITHIVIDEFKDRFGRLTPLELQVRATELGQIFPSEPQDSWYQPTNSKDSCGNKVKLRKQAKGRLYDRNLNYKLSTAACTSMPKQQSLLLDFESSAILETQLAEYRQTKTWLDHNQDEWEEVRKKWQQFSKIRFIELDKLENRTCASILKELPTLRNHQGYQLVQLDFQNRFPGKDTLLFDRWTKFVYAVRPILDAEVRDSEGRSLLALLDSDNIRNDARDAIIVSLLVHILPSPILTLTDKIRWKPTILESKESILVYVQNQPFLESTLARLFNAWRSKGVPAVPLIVVFGEDKINLTGFTVWTNAVPYKFPNFLKALDICIKFYMTYDIDFPRQSVAAWKLLSECLFDLSPSSDQANVKALRLAICSKFD